MRRGRAPHAPTAPPALRSAWHRRIAATIAASLLPLPRMTIPAPARLPYRKPHAGRDYWVVDEALPNPDAVRARSLARADWIHGFPANPEVTWPGLRCAPALQPDELAALEQRVLQLTGSRRVWMTDAALGDAHICHNHIQVVGATDSTVRPHTDSRRLCRYAAVIYLTPGAPANAGTGFFRQRLPGGGLGGNICPPPHANLVEALGVRRLPLDAWQLDLAVDNVYNRLVLYRADLVHSALRYFGRDLDGKRMTALFFWMAD